MHFRGVFTTLPTTLTDYNPGDVVLVGGKEYVLALNGADNAKKWNELGDEGSHALKSITINGDGTYITGGGNLQANRTLSHKTYTAASANIILASGIPIECTACIAEFATTKALGFAIPTSSDAAITILLAKNIGSSPAFKALAK